MTQPKTETRNFAVRAAAGDDFVLTGYAALFNSESKDLGGFTETIAPGAFDRTLAANGEVKFTFNHSLDKMLARTKNGSLVLSTDERGLKFRAQLDKGSPLHVEIFRAVKSGLVDECSFAFCCAPNGQVWSADGTKRTLTDVDLLDCAAVSNPAYNGTSVDARAAADASWTDFLKRVLDMPNDWKRSDRLHAANLAVIAGCRSDDDDSEVDDGEDYTDELQEAIGERFGATRSGAHPAHYLISYDATRCYTRHLDSDTRCSMTYKRSDKGDYEFGEVEPDGDYTAPDERAQTRLATARQLQADEALRIRCAHAAGRSK